MHLDDNAILHKSHAFNLISKVIFNQNIGVNDC